MAVVYYVGDFGKKITAVLTDICTTCNGTGRVAGVTCAICSGTGRIPYNLTGYTASFICQKPDGTVVTKVGIVEVPATDGKASYTWLDGELDLDGRWYVVVEIKSGVAVEAHGEFEFFVRRVPA